MRQFSQIPMISLLLVAGLLRQNALAICPGGGDLILSEGSNGCVTVTGYCTAIAGVDVVGSVLVCPGNPVTIKPSGSVTLGGQTLSGEITLYIDTVTHKLCVVLGGCHNAACLVSPEVCVPI